MSGAARGVDNAAMLPHSFIYLASQSPRRRQLLDQLGVSHRLLLPDRGEDAEALEAVRRASCRWTTCAASPRSSSTPRAAG